MSALCAFSKKDAATSSKQGGGPVTVDGEVETYRHRLPATIGGVAEGQVVPVEAHVVGSRRTVRRRPGLDMSRAVNRLVTIRVSGGAGRIR